MNGSLVKGEEGKEGKCREIVGESKRKKKTNREKREKEEEAEEGGRRGNSEKK